MKTVVVRPERDIRVVATVTRESISVAMLIDEVEVDQASNFVDHEAVCEWVDEALISRGRVALDEDEADQFRFDLHWEWNKRQH